jgi:hypothetical protein
MLGSIVDLEDDGYFRKERPSYCSSEVSGGVERQPVFPWLQLSSGK